MSDTSPQLCAHDLYRHYREAGGHGERRVLEGVALSARAGECVALLGRSGSGKSTLLNLLAGIDRPDRGWVEVAGTRLSTLGEPALTRLRRRRIGFIYQSFNLIDELTVAENIALPLALDGVRARDARPRIAAMLERLGLGGRANAFPDQLSGGEQQRVAIGRALIHEPALILADEPTGNLDADTGARVLELLAALFREHGRTLVLVTHSRAVAAIADRVLTLERGRLRADDTALSW
ncbi:ABC transporter ATP-binding protein [Marichromatium bheemlicum]|uniref:ABC transporter ATP-binding protein n=1 Tax=Marichromatium bheemlicum TaxID=365339 RepID=A0ABX1I9K3_9GAMM|nr:ABC transporter ATP-binding protein [Marichromatium bheemlicum]NKN33923.1 ABC transporter ATP-binding protein [Marichromatium bheemlicum]